MLKPLKRYTPGNFRQVTPELIPFLKHELNQYVLILSDNSEWASIEPITYVQLAYYMDKLISTNIEDIHVYIKQADLGFVFEEEKTPAKKTNDTKEEVVKQVKQQIKEIKEDKDAASSDNS